MLTRMFKHALARWMAALTPCFDAIDAGGGGGAGAGGVADGGASAGAGGGAAPYVLTNDSLVDFGDGKAVKWGEATGDNGRYMSRDRYDRGVQYLTGEARRLEQKWAEYHAGAGPKPTQADPNANANQNADPLAGIRNNAIVSGQDLDGVFRELYAKGLGPIAQHLAQLAAQNKQMQTQLQGVAQHTGSLTEERQMAQFENDVTATITGLGEIKGLGTLDPKNETLRELAKDVFLSHEQNSWKPGDFGKALKTRVESLFGLFRDQQKAEVTRARDIRKNTFFAKPTGGNASGQGEPKYQHRSGSQLAAAVFGSAEQPT